MKQFESVQENISKPSIEIDSEFIKFIPQEFLDDPAGYFEREGKNIKTGEIKYDEAGVFRGWKLKDMVFEVDVENKKITSMTPTDWERTIIVEKTQT